MRAFLFGDNGGHVTGVCVWLDKVSSSLHELQSKEVTHRLYAGK